MENFTSSKAKQIIGLCFLLPAIILTAKAQSQDAVVVNAVVVDTVAILKDTQSLSTDSFSQREQMIHKDKQRDVSSFLVRLEGVNMKGVSQLSYLSVQQILKGKVAGVYVQETTGEPGTVQSMIIRGLPAPVFSRKDVSGVQPTVYINGIPVIHNHTFVYDIQQYDVNPIGPATNLLAGLDVANIASLEVIKDPLELAKLGPLAANGAIWITTNNGYTRGPHVIINTVAGFAAPPLKIRPVSAAYERDFRNRFYSKYGITDSEQYLPVYLKDEGNENYYGAADWPDTYYRFAPQYSMNASIGGGGSLADYLFAVGIANSPGIADETSYYKYNVSFFINMIPFDGFLMRCMLSGGKGERARNMNFRDRFAETEYVPDLSLPVTPYGYVYRQYTDDFSENGIDDNTTNMLNAYLDLSYTIKKLRITTRMQVDYNSNVRHFFLPSTLMESVSYVSEYSGYNRRVIGEGMVDYSFGLHDRHFFNVGYRGSFMADKHNYNYIKGYGGENDEYKTSKSGNYKLYRYKDNELSNMVSTSAFIDYRYKNLFSANALVRYDGHSNVPTDKRWLFTPAAGVKWNLKEQFMRGSGFVSELNIGISAARIGVLTQSDRFTLGNQYTSEDLNWLGQSVISSYAGYPSVTRSYSNGWIGYGAGWAYSDKASVDINGSLFNKRLTVALSVYDNTGKDLTIRTSVPQEFGYKYRYLSGMKILNRGFDVCVGGDIFSSAKGLNWNASVNLNYNYNELTALPENMDELVIDDRKLKVGESIDRFWLYENRGIYESNDAVPSKEGIALSVDGTALGAGDPRWVDRNGDNVIDVNDKTLKGHAMPPLTGGMTNSFRYGNFDLQLHLLFALGHNAVNSRDRQRYDFTTLDFENYPESVREIYFWQNTHQKDNYPLYNPLSTVRPYREDQDLFLENLSYLKLRQVTLGYTIPMKHSMYVYVTANNLFTFSKFSGKDPELVEFNGYYTGYTQPLPKTLLLGMRFKF